MGGLLLEDGEDFFCKMGRNAVGRWGGVLLEDGEERCWKMGGVLLEDGRSDVKCCYIHEVTAAMVIAQD